MLRVKVDISLLKSCLLVFIRVVEKGLLTMLDVCLRWCKNMIYKHFCLEEDEEWTDDDCDCDCDCDDSEDE